MLRLLRGLVSGDDAAVTIALTPEAQLVTGPIRIAADGGPMELTLGRHQIQAKDPSTGEVIHGGDFDVAAGDKTLRINFRYSAEP